MKANTYFVQEQVHFQANTAWKYLNLLLESKCLLLEDLKNSQEEKVYLKMQLEAGRKPVDSGRFFWLQKNSSWAIFFLVVISTSLCLFTFPFLLIFCCLIFTGTDALFSYQRNATDSKTFLKFLKRQSYHSRGTEFLSLMLYLINSIQALKGCHI